VLGEGCDEWEHRYFKFGIRGSDTDISPFSAKEISDSPNDVFGELTDAGANASESAKAELVVADDLLDQASNGKYLVQRPISSGAKGNKGHRWVHAFSAKNPARSRSGLILGSPTR
jgi:hypothetical protein